MRKLRKVVKAKNWNKLLFQIAKNIITITKQLDKTKFLKFFICNIKQMICLILKVIIKLFNDTLLKTIPKQWYLFKYNLLMV